MKQGLFLGALLICANLSHADPALSWSEALTLASKNNAQLQAAQASLQSARYLENGSYSEFLPQISGELEYSRSGSNISSSTGGGQYSAALQGRQNLFAGFADSSSIKKAKAAVQIAEAELQTAKALVSADLKNSYEGSSYAQEFQKLTQSIIRRRQENFKLVDLRFQTGRENKGSVLLSEANLNQAKYEDLQAQNALRTAQAQLAKSLGLDEFSTYQVSENVPVSPPPQLPPDLKLLATTTPEYIRAQAQLESASADLTSARSAFLPSLDLTGSVGRSDTDFYPEANKNWTVGLSLSLPIFNGGRDYHGTRSAAALKSSADHARFTASRELLVNLQRAYSTYVESVMKLQVDESFRRASTMRAEIARNKYNNGLLSFEDWDLIESDLINRQKAYLQTRRDRVASEAAWEKAQGKGAIP